jgi:glycosyltransferase involved in cell wall biosynthesis
VAASVKILVLTTSWPRHLGDIAGSFVYHWCLSLADRGHHLHVLYPQHPTSTSVPLPPQEGLSAQPISYPLQKSLFYGAGAPDNLSRSFRPWLEAPLFVAALLREARKLAPHFDQVVAHWLLPCGLVAAHTNKPFSCIAHSGDVSLLERLPRPIARLFASMLRRGKLAAVAPHLQRRLAAYDLHAQCLPMGVESLVFDAVQEREAAREALQLNKFTILAMGRLVPIKGFDLLLSALEGLDVTLLLAGDGPLRTELCKSAAQKGIDLRYLGVVSGTAKRQAFAAADCLCLPSRQLGTRSEGMPVTILEAFAAGLPVIASNVGGPRDCIQHGVTGFLVEEGNVQALRDAVEKLVRRPDVLAYVAENARKEAERLRWENIAACYETGL